jgi:hypothetical protein
MNLGLSITLHDLPSWDMPRMQQALRQVLAAFADNAHPHFGDTMTFDVMVNGSPTRCTISYQIAGATGTVIT